MDEAEQGPISFVPVDGDWRVAMVWGCEEEGWHGFCHPVVAWRVSPYWCHADPVYPFPPHYIDSEDGDIIGEPHRADEDFCQETDEVLLGGKRIGERPMCEALREALLTARIRAEMSRRRAAAAT